MKDPGVPPAHDTTEPTWPAPHEWNAAIVHSVQNGEHVLVPYDDLDGTVHMECRCGFDTADIAVPAAAGREETPDA
jgi:hypothetical protein